MKPLFFFFGPQRVSHMGNSECMLEYGWVGPRSWGYRGLQAHEVFQDLIEIYHSSPATAWMPPYFNETETPKLRFSYQKNWVFLLKTIVNFYKKRKIKAKQILSFHTQKPNLCLWFEGLYLVVKGRGIS